jgi:putative ABC transport system permease protein
VYIFPSVWKNPWNNERRSINTIGFDPDQACSTRRGFEDAERLLRRQDVVLFDGASRPEFGPVAESSRPGPVTTEINDREIEVVGMFEMGTSFGIDGTVITSDDNWLRLFPERPRSDIQLGLIRLKPGQTPSACATRCANTCPTTCWC